MVQPDTFKLALSIIVYTERMSLLYDNQEIHRGHAEARHALGQWVNYIRTRSQEVVKDWNACETMDPDRLPLEQKLERGDFGENVISIGIKRPTLDSLSQLPEQSYTYPTDNSDLTGVIAEINKAVKAYFYAPATAITYVDFCRLLEEIKEEA